MTRIPVGGVENQLLQVLRTYDRTKLLPLVVSLADKGDIGREIEAGGTEVVCLNQLGHQFRWSIVTGLERLMRERDIHIVRTHQYHANLYGRLAAIKADVPCTVASVHNLYTRDSKFHRRLLNRFLARYTDKVVAVSEPVREDILRYDRIPPEKVTVITNGVDVARFSGAEDIETRAGLGIEPDALVIGTVARLTPQKDTVTLLEAVARLEDRSGLKVLIVGDGPLREELTARARELGISEQVIFAGIRRDIPELLSAMDIFVLPSLWEGMPNALIEALASGKAVVTSDIQPFTAIVDSDDIGLTFPQRDLAALSSQLARLIEDEELRKTLGTNALKRAEERHSIKSTVRAYTELFEFILREKGY
jgi:glycosyltransferase involved in cell wall biosynthesis